jgi:hypothetical protein
MTKFLDIIISKINLTLPQLNKTKVVFKVDLEIHVININ